MEWIQTCTEKILWHEQGVECEEVSMGDRIRQILGFKMKIGFKMGNANFKSYHSSLVNLREYLSSL